MNQLNCCMAMRFFQCKNHNTTYRGTIVFLCLYISRQVQEVKALGSLSVKQSSTAQNKNGENSTPHDYMYQVSVSEVHGTGLQQTLSYFCLVCSTHFPIIVSCVILDFSC